MNRLLTFIILVLHLSSALGQSIWDARWISHPKVEDMQYAVLHFKNVFHLSTKPEHLKIRISADIRYKLYLNGQYLGQGPANNDLYHYSHDTYDLTDSLKIGENILTAEVWSFGALNPLRFESKKARLIVMAEDSDFSTLNTGKGNWYVEKSEAYSPTRRYIDFNLPSYYAMGGGEQVDGSKYNWQWKNADTLGQWMKPVSGLSGEVYGNPDGYGTYDVSLSARSIPMMDESEESRPVVRKAEGWKDESIMGAWSSGEQIVVSPNSELTLLLDQQYLTKGFPKYTFSKGRGGQVTFTYSESLYEKDGTKGNRDEIEDKKIQGLMDRYLLNGEKDQTYCPLLSRTWRYIEVRLKAGEEEIIWESYEANKFMYPFEQVASFSSDDKSIERILEAGWRTSRMCADETYMDTPYFEQLQYIGDTRIQALISLFNSGDDRLMKNALQQFSNSITDEGITQSRFPSWERQYIPPYALFFVNMVHDFHMYREDPEFTKTFLNDIASILMWFENRLTDDYLLGPMPWWSYVDSTPGFQRASPPGSKEGGSVTLSLQFVYALQDAIALFEYYDKNYLVNHFKVVKESIQKAVNNLAFDSGKSMYADTKEKTSFSQHTNIFAILTNTFEINKQSDLFNAIVTDSSLIQANIYFQFYLFQAAQKTGNGDYLSKRLFKWEELIDLGLTTFPEYFGNTRSDCHAWSAFPSYEVYHTMVGIQSVRPHFGKVLIEPNLGDLQNVRAKIPHPRGEIAVEIKSENGSKYVSINLPLNTYGDFKWKGIMYEINSGLNRIIVR